MALYVEYVNCNVNEIICHRIGNKLRGDGVSFADKAMSMDESTKGTFFRWVLGDFVRCTQCFNLHNDVDLNFNRVFSIVSRLFEDRHSFVLRSHELARHLYEHSTHPKVQEGELIVVYLEDCILDGETVDAIGLFKVEHKVRNLSYNYADNTLESSFTIDASKVDNGCLIYNTHKEDGYVVQVVSNVKNPLQDYWYNDFLRVRERRDSSYYTAFVIRCIVQYLQQSMDATFEVPALLRAKLLSQTAEWFAEKDTFTSEEFCMEVFNNNDVKSDFENYMNRMCAEFDIVMVDNFTICNDALKRNQRKMKPKIKVNTLTEIHLKGIDKGIEECTDEQGNKFLKILINQ